MKTPLIVVASLVAFFTSSTVAAYDPTISLDYALCGYGGGAACANMGYHTSWDVLNAIEPDPYYYHNVQTYPMDCIDVGTGWCGEAQSWLTYARADNYPYWAPQYSYYETPYAHGYNYYYDNYQYDWSQYYDYSQQNYSQYYNYSDASQQYTGYYPYNYSQTSCGRCYSF